MTRFAAFETRAVLLVTARLVFALRRYMPFATAIDTIQIVAVAGRGLLATRAIPSITILLLATLAIPIVVESSALEPSFNNGQNSSLRIVINSLGSHARKNLRLLLDVVLALLLTFIRHTIAISIIVSPLHQVHTLSVASLPLKKLHIPINVVLQLREGGKLWLIKFHGHMGVQVWREHLNIC